MTSLVLAKFSDIFSVVYLLKVMEDMMEFIRSIIEWANYCSYSVYDCSVRLDSYDVDANIFTEDVSMARN